MSLQSHEGLQWNEGIRYTLIPFLFRDNGISIKSLLYQLYSELFMFVVVLIVMAPFEKSIILTRIIGILNTIVVFVIQPLFYLSGDANFRNRVFNLGLWKALRIEIFRNTSQIERTEWLPTKKIVYTYHVKKT